MKLTQYTHCTCASFCAGWRLRRPPGAPSIPLPPASHGRADSRPGRRAGPARPARFGTGSVVPAGDCGFSPSRSVPAPGWERSRSAGSIVTATRVLSGYPDYAAEAGKANPHLPGLGRWFVVAAPVVAGLIYGPLVHFFAREARGHGVPEVMYAVAERGGRIRPRVAGVKALASAVCIGGGGSVGREGPIVQIGSALGSTLGQWVRLPESRLRLLVACGAAGGIAATFNAPVAGVFFALELILADFAVDSFAAVVLAAVTAVGHRPGDSRRPPVPRTAHLPRSPARWSTCSTPCSACSPAGTGVGFTRILYLVEDALRLGSGPDRSGSARRSAACCSAACCWRCPQMYGVGYPVLGKAVAGGYPFAVLLILLVGKMLATSLTIGIGGSGGVFAPSLVHRCHARRRRSGSSSTPSHPRWHRPPARTPSSEWARSSPEPPVPPSPRSSSCSS